MRYSDRVPFLVVRGILTLLAWLTLKDSVESFRVGNSGAGLVSLSFSGLFLLNIFSNLERIWCHRHDDLQELIAVESKKKQKIFQLFGFLISMVFLAGIVLAV